MSESTTHPRTYTDFRGCISKEEWNDTWASDIIVKNDKMVKCFGDVGLEFQALENVWAFRYASDLGADNSGVYFNVGATSIEFRLLNSPTFTCDLSTGTVSTSVVKALHKCADGTSPVADGTYTVGIGAAQNGTITIQDGIITAIQEASD